MRDDSRPAKTPLQERGWSLANRFDTHRDMILAFLHDLSIPLTNNAAEREVRPVKVKQRSGGCWRTLDGLADFAIIWSYLSTAAKHGLDHLDVLVELFTTGPWLPPDPAPAEQAAPHQVTSSPAREHRLGHHHALPPAREANRESHSRSR